MSRSYKKNPVYTDRPNGAKYWKRCANKKVRRYKDNLDDGKMYRRIYNSWDIHDYINRWTKEEAIDYWYKVQTEAGYRWYDITKDYPTLENFLDKCWAPDFYWK